MNDWKSFSEALPHKDYAILLATVTPNGYIRRTHEDVVFMREHMRFWLKRDNCYKEEMQFLPVPTHWMQLPEPPIYTKTEQLELGS
jgi:hypothetical protein